MAACLFCSIVNGEIPCDQVLVNDEFVAFRDVNPQAPVHILVVPKRHIATIQELSTKDEGLISRLILLANEIAEQEKIVQKGYRLVLNCNPWGGQSVFHVHLHILGGRPMTWPPG